MKKQVKLQFRKGSKVVGELEGEIVNIDNDLPKPADLLPWFAVGISVISILFTAFQASETRENNRIAVLPQLVVSRFGLAKKSIGILIENDGLGPAVVRSYNVYYKKVKLCSIKQLRESIRGPLKIPIEQLPYVEIENGYFYRPGQRVDLLSEGTNTNALSDDNRARIWNDLSNNTDIEIEYCSVYDECHYACLHRADQKCIRAP